MTKDQIKELRFWRVELDDNNNLRKITINQLQFCQFLRHYGFIRHTIQGEDAFYKIINERIIKPVTITEMQDFVFDWIEALDKIEDFDVEPVDNFPAILSNKVLTGITVYFNKQKLNWLRPDKPLEFNKDTLTSKFLYYKNGYVEITKQGPRLRDYDTLQNYIWASQLLSRSIDLKAKIESNNVADFMFKVSEMGNPEYQGRYFSLQTITGYLLHDFFDYKLKMPLFTDSTVGDDDTSNGRTGKTLYGRLIGHMVSDRINDPTIKAFVEIGMKDFKADDKHKWSRVGHDSKLVALNDLKPYFNMDILYNAITDGMQVDRKNKDPFLTMCKLLATSNKTVRIEGRSSADRVVEFEFTDYFNDTKTPEMEYGEWFFRDWNTKDWNDYDLTMIKAITAFMKNDCKIDKPTAINLNERKLREHTSHEFLEFIREIEMIGTQVELDKNKLFTDFKSKYQDFEKDNRFTQRRFTTWIKQYMNLSDHLENWDSDKSQYRTKEASYYVFRIKSN